MKIIDEFGLDFSKKPISLALFLYVIFFEIFVGGGGSLVRYGDLSLRMALLVIYLLLFIYFISVHRCRVAVDLDTLLVTVVIVWTGVSALIGLYNNNEYSYIVNDVKPMMYFILYYPMRFTVDYYRMSYRSVYNILLVSSVVISLIVIVIYYYSTFVDISNFHLYVEKINNIFGEGTIWFRSGGKGVFYTGLVYLVVANIFIFYIFTTRRLKLYEILIFSLNSSAVMISNTRGIIFMMVFGLFFIVIFGKLKTKAIALFSLALFCVFLMYLFLGFERLSYESISKDSATNVRMDSFYETIEIMNHAPFFGNGFGTELQNKAGHQENSYLDIALEQGLIGLILYVLIFYNILKGLRSYRGTIYIAFAASIASLMMMSATNPYINNPLGIILILLAMIYKKESVKVRE